MRNVLFSVGPFTVYGYGFMIAIGVICAFIVGCTLAKRSKLDDDALFSMGLIGIVGGIAGAKLLYYIVEFKSIMENPSILLHFTEGFVVYGGLIAGFLLPIFYARARKLKFLSYLDCAVPGVALAQGFGRIGCFLAGCCYGKETDAWYGVTFAIDSLAPAGKMVIPTQLISATGDFILAIILIIMHFLLYKRAEDKRMAGAVSAVYLMLYAAGRFAVEFLRDDPRGSVGILSTSQFIAIFMFIVGAGIQAGVAVTYKKQQVKK